MASTDAMEKGVVESYTLTDGSIHPLNRPEPKPLKHGLSTCLRLLTFAATLAAFIVMVTNKQTLSFPFEGPSELTTNYHFQSAFVWFAVATAIVFVYSVFAILGELCMVSKNTHSSYLLWVMFGLDMVSNKFQRHHEIVNEIMMNILMSACAASLAVELLGQNGNSHVQWSGFCTGFGSFCDHVTGALVAGAVGFAGLAELCILDAYHLYTQYTRY